MLSITLDRRSSLAAVASVSLLVGFGASAGQAAAAQTTSGSTIIKNSLPGNRVKPNSLTGVQINEARLGLVPAAKLSKFAEFAKSADSAKTATFAESARTAETARSAQTAETARTAESARTADTAKNAEKLNGRDENAFLANSVRTVSRQTADVPTNGGAAVTVSCNADEKGIGGGAVWLIPGSNTPTELNAPLTASMPQPALTGVNSMTGWTAAGRNLAGADRVLRAYVTCVPKTA